MSTLQFIQEKQTVQWQISAGAILQGLTVDQINSLHVQKQDGFLA
jgi:hypothetical protein